MTGVGVTTISIETATSTDAGLPASPPRRGTKHLKANPEPRSLRETIKAESFRLADKLDRSRPYTRAELERWSRALLEELGLDEKYLGFTMVTVGNAFWRQQFVSTPFNRRLLLLPHCLKHAEGCPADYDDYGLDCKKCGACNIADFKVKAEQLGYKVLVAEGTPIVLKIIISGYVDAILGVACLNVLEKAIDKVLLAGVPAYAVPLHSGDCKNTSLDEEWLHEMIDCYEERPTYRTRSYVPVLRAANSVFDENFERLLPAKRNKASAGDPIAATEAIALDFLRHGGKRLRPFITLAAYQTLAAEAPTLPDDPAGRVEFSDPVQRVALAIEAFHKASLVHDDIEDDDDFRYGAQTVHRRHGIPMAINVGDHRLGAGYRLLAECRTHDAAAAADISFHLADAHIRLSEGQGAELAWRNSTDKRLKPIDVLKIFALKTAPAFEAALYAGARMAAVAERYQAMIPLFSRHVGIAFQILNDLKDWAPDANNKLATAQDALAMRPTILLALALDAATPEQRTVLERLLANPMREAASVESLRRIYEEIDVFDKARRLIEKNRERAEAAADEVEPPEFRELLYFIIDTVLEEETPEPADPSVISALPIIAVTTP